MAELITIARPYAQAVFDLAKEQGQFPKWSEMLEFLAEVYANDRVQAALANPEHTKDDVERLLLGICGDRLDNSARNLLIVLVRNNRLAVLPSIATLYEQLREQYENIVEAGIQSAFPLDEAQVKALVARLEKRTGHKVKANVGVDRALIGGVRVQIGDDVWDASVRGQLDAMANALTS